MSDQLKIALAYAKSGVRVFPVKRNKSPANGKGGHNKATTDENTIRAWWGKHKNAYVGAPNDQFVVIDVDYKNVCKTVNTLTDVAVDNLKKSGVITDTTPAVRTKSGGYHYYFKKDDSITRRTFVLPNIDLLAQNGFSVLPGQDGYQPLNFSKSPHSTMKRLPKLKLDRFNDVVESMVDITKTASKLKQEYRKEQLRQADYQKVKDPSTPAPPNSANYRKDEVEFEQTPDMYKSGGEKKTTGFVIDDDGYIDLRGKSFDTEMINSLFHNVDIQKRLGHLLELKVPAVGEVATMRSILPDHVDATPSMGVRWDTTRTHILIRDFSNHFADKYDQVDYNVVRMYATIKYRALVPRLKPPEFVVWFVRMLYEANLLRLDDIKKSYAEDYNSYPDFIKKTEKSIAESFLLLDAVKSLYSGYDGTTTFSDKFASAWTGFSLSVVNRVKRILTEIGFLEIVGVYNCRSSLDDNGFYNTSLYKVVSDSDKYYETDEETPEMSDNEIVTSVELPVSQETYAKIGFFCTDFGIENMPRRSNMFIQTACSTGVHKPDIDVTGTVYLVGDLQLEVVDSYSSGDKVLMAVGESPALEDLSMSHMKQFPEESEPCIDEPLIGIVLSYSYEEVGDLDTMTSNFNAYVGGKLSFEDVQVRYATTEEMFDYVLDGKDIDD